MAHRRIVALFTLVTVVLLAVSSLSAASGPVYLPLLFTTHTPAMWLEVGAGSASGGGISNNSGRSEVPSLAIALDGTLYVAWEDSGSASDEMYVRRWDGSVWQEVGAGSASGGGISNNGDGAWFASLAIAPDGTPYVARRDGEGNDEIYIRRWDGSSWREIGAGSASGYVAWRDDSGGHDDIYALYWDSLGWTSVGTGSASGGGISKSSDNSWKPSLDIAPDGTPYVAWYDPSGGNLAIYLRRYTR